MVREAGLTSAAAGNIGRPLLDAAGDDVDVVVAEVSSFQLAFTTDAFAPDVAVLLNVAEDHLDWHGTADAYAQAKARLFAHQGPDGLLVVNGDDPVAAALSLDAPGRVVRFTTGATPTLGAAVSGYGVAGGDARGPGRRRRPGARRPARRTTPPTRSPPRPRRAAVGADADAIARTLAGFAGLAHRVQLVGERDGVHFYDDSKATNPHATASALGRASSTWC